LYYVQVAKILQLVADNVPSIGAYSRCLWMQVSSKCREALLKSRGNSTAVLTLPTAQSLAQSPASATELLVYAQKLARAGHLYSDFTMHCDEQARQSVVHCMQRHFAQAFVSTHQTTIGLPVLLQGFGTNYVPAPELLALMSSMSLNKLHVNRLWERTMDIPTGWPAAVGQLTSLHEIYLNTQHGSLASTEPVYVKGIAAALGKLRGLARLAVDVDITAFEAGDAQHLPQSLHALHAGFISSDRDTFVVLSHLTALQGLAWGRI
jgi:hypothetical protein